MVSLERRRKRAYQLYGEFRGSCSQRSNVLLMMMCGSSPSFIYPDFIYTAHLLLSHRPKSRCQGSVKIHIPSLFIRLTSQLTHSRYISCFHISHVHPEVSLGPTCPPNTHPPVEWGWENMWISYLWDWEEWLRGQRLTGGQIVATLTPQARAVLPG